jgi:hypothetical protein
VNFYSASSLKQQSTDRHVAPLDHIILIPSQPVLIAQLAHGLPPITIVNNTIYSRDDITDTLLKLITNQPFNESKTVTTETLVHSFYITYYMLLININSSRIDMSLHSITLFWFRANQSLLFLLNAACLAEKQQIPILKSLVWPDRGSNPRSTALEASTLALNTIITT